MDESSIRKLLKEVATQKTSVAKALSKLRHLPFESLESANLDHHRQLRTGIPEVVYGESKTSEQIIEISRRIVEHGGPLLVTRVDDDKGKIVAQSVEGAIHHPVSRTVYRKTRPYKKPRGLVAVLTAGTSDIPIAEEAAITLEIMGDRPWRVYDVGVAGIHRLVDKLPRLQEARAVIVAAGMEGALASIVGGLVRCPVIALPTSVGYGVGLGGFSALLGMLTSCAPGVTVVNIDNGFGAAVAAALINRRGRY